MGFGSESLERLGARVGKSMDLVAPADVAAREGRARFLAKVHQPARKSFSLSLTFGVLGVAATVALVFVFRPANITSGFVAAGVQGEVGALLLSETKTMALQFVEGSHVELDPQGQLRVAEFGTRKARVQLQRGRAHLSITKGLGRAWAVEAGPFAVNVTGTRFSVDWQPEEHRMEVVLHEGSVVVTGACLGGERRLVAPDRMVADCDKKPVAFAAEATEAEEEREAAPPTGAVPIATAPPSISWRQLVKAGHYEEALANAKRAGFSRICKTATAAELLDLGDAARLAGDTGAAEQALTALHSRFPHTPQSALASFNLGRLAFDQRRNFDAASTHFSRYIAEEPTGALVGDAWGRLLEARSKSRDPTAAANDARTYLARFSNGPYSGLARRLIQNAQP